MLGIKNGASQKEIKRAYHEMVKKYHPDQYHDNPLSDLAQEKMKEINEAYSILTEGGDYSQSNAYGSAGSSFPDFSAVRQKIQAGNMRAAEEMLMRLDRNNAEWHFLYAVLCSQKNWIDAALEHIDTAVSMDQLNQEYRQFRESLFASGKSYTTTSGQRGYGQTRNNDLCQLCTCLYCSDCCCEALGGDLINCM